MGRCPEEAGVELWTEARIGVHQEKKGEKVAQTETRARGRRGQEEELKGFRMRKSHCEWERE